MSVSVILCEIKYFYMDLSFSTSSRDTGAVAGRPRFLSPRGGSHNPTLLCRLPQPRARI